MYRRERGVDLLALLSARKRITVSPKMSNFVFIVIILLPYLPLTPRLNHGSLIIPPGPRCEAATVISCHWHGKRKNSKVSISNGGFILKWQLCVSAIMWKLLQWTPLINFVFWNGSHGSSKYISFILIQRLNMWSPALLFSVFLVNFFFHSLLSVSWK